MTGKKSLAGGPQPSCLSLAESAFFEIPVLPRGRVLTFRILSTWGDPHYVGLAGIEPLAIAGPCDTVISPAIGSADPPLCFFLPPPLKAAFLDVWLCAAVVW